MKQSWKEGIIIWGITFIFFSLLGIYVSQFKHYLPFDSLARLVSAWLVFSGTEVKLATIGFLWPPIPTLVILPFVIIQPLVQSWLAVVLVSATFMALGCVTIGYIAVICGLSDRWRRLTVLLFTVQPFIFMFGANGMSEAILVTLTLAGCYWLIRFWQTDRNTHLIFSAGFFGLLPLVRYEYALLTAWSAIILVILSWKRRTEFSDVGFRNFLEGRLLAYSSLAIYPIFIWSVASWFVMGNPFYFLINDRSAVSLSELHVASYAELISSSFIAMITVLRAWFWVFPLGTIASLVGLVIGLRNRISFIVGMSLMPFILPGLQYVLLAQQASIPLLRYFIIAIPLGVAVALIVLSNLMPELVANPTKSNILMWGYTVLFIISTVSSIYLLDSYQYQTQERETWRALTGSSQPENVEFEEAYALGKELQYLVPEDSRILIDTFHFGFAVMLGVGDHKLFMDFTDPNYEKALTAPWDYVDYVLVPKSEGRGALYSVNIAHRKLHAEGATWATQMDDLPVTEQEWKLYKVER